MDWYQLRLTQSTVTFCFMSQNAHRDRGTTWSCFATWGRKTNTQESTAISASEKYRKSSCWLIHALLTNPFCSSLSKLGLTYYPSEHPCKVSTLFFSSCWRGTAASIILPQGIKKTHKNQSWSKGRNLWSPHHMWSTTPQTCISHQSCPQETALRCIFKSTREDPLTFVPITTDSNFILSIITVTLWP